jgi:hypothetical protein
MSGYPSEAATVGEHGPDLIGVATAQHGHELLQRLLAAGPPLSTVEATRDTRGRLCCGRSLAIACISSATACQDNDKRK